MYSYGLPHMDEKRLNDQLEPIYSSSVPIQNVAWKTWREWWTIAMGDERGSEKSMLAAWQDDDDNDDGTEIFMLSLYFLLFLKNQYSISDIELGF